MKFFLLIGLLFSTIINATQINCEVDSVHDSDTLKAKCPGEPGLTRIRFYCIDAPEKSQEFWDLGMSDLKLLKTISVDVKQTDIYGRKVGEIFAENGINVNKYLIETGAAAVYPEYCTDQSYYDLQKIAKEHNIGIWNKPGMHQTPWLYRKQKRQK